MSFWENVKKFTQPYSDDEYDDYDDEDVLDDYEEEAEESAPRARRTPSFSAPAKDEGGLDFGSVSAPASSTPSGFSGQVLNTGFGSKQEVVLFHAANFNDASRAADNLRNKKAVILNMENVDKALTRRVVDFLSGCVYALDGTVRKVAQSTYLFCPHGMDVVGDLENLQSDAESYI